MIDYELSRPQFEKLKEYNEKNGYVTFDEIQNLFPDATEEDLSDLYDYLDAINITVTRTDDNLDIDIEKELEEKDDMMMEDEAEEDMDSSMGELGDEEPSDEDLLVEEENDIKLSDFDALDAVSHQTDDTVRMYLHEIGMVPLLDVTQEIQLAKAVQNGLSAQEKLEKNNAELTEEEKKNLNKKINEGRASQNILIESNLRLVVSIAKRYTNRGLPLADLIQEGNGGLMKAVIKFDHTRGCKFSTYATWWIRQGIVRAIADKGRNVRIPVHMHESINRLGRIKRKLIQELHREPTIEELAKELNCPVEKVVELQKVALDSISFDASVGDEDDSTLIDLVPDENTLNPLAYTEKLIYTQELNSILQTLTPREEMVIRYRYGIGVDHPHTLEEVGKIMNVTRERVRQIESKAISRLRRHRRRIEKI